MSYFGRRRRRASSWSRDADYGGFPAYVPVAERRVKALAAAAKLAKGGKMPEPVTLERGGRAIAQTFWGKAWCENLERYSDYSNRLPRGRSYLRSGAVVDLGVAGGSVTARVQGTSLYTIAITIAPAASARWQALVKECAGEIGSLVDLLRGKLPERVMEIMTAPGAGLFPAPKEIELRCSCPDWATMCKHVAAVLYGIGVRLDSRPELFFLLRGVSADELIAQAAAGGALTAVRAPPKKKLLAGSDLSALFGIELESAPMAAKKGPTGRGAKPVTRGAPPAMPAPSGEQKAPTGRKPRSPKARAAGADRCTRAELRALGVATRTIALWIERGDLIPAGEPEVFRTSALGRELVAMYRAR